MAFISGTPDIVKVVYYLALFVCRQNTLVSPGLWEKHFFENAVGEGQLIVLILLWLDTSVSVKIICVSSWISTAVDSSSLKRRWNRSHLCSCSAPSPIYSYLIEYMQIATEIKSHLQRDPKGILYLPTPPTAQVFLKTQIFEEHSDNDTRIWKRHVPYGRPSVWSRITLMPLLFCESVHLWSSYPLLLSPLL